MWGRLPTVANLPHKESARKRACFASARDSVGLKAVLRPPSYAWHVCVYVCSQNNASCASKSLIFQERGSGGAIATSDFRLLRFATPRKSCDWPNFSQAGPPTEESSSANNCHGNNTRISSLQFPRRNW